MLDRHRESRALSCLISVFTPGMSHRARACTVPQPVQRGVPFCRLTCLTACRATPNATGPRLHLNRREQSRHCQAATARARPKLHHQRHGMRMQTDRAHSATSPT